MTVRAARARGLVALLMVTSVVAGCGPTVTLKVAPTTPAPTVVAGVGAPGLGDPYTPLAGNGGYDVGHYDLNLRYTPTTRVLSGTATITATATSALTRFNLDLRALQASTVTVNGVPARAEATGDELVVTPASTLPAGSTMTVRVTYSGVPRPYQDGEIGQVGFLSTADGALAVGEPAVAAAWFPVNDHPRDKASYTIVIAAPAGLDALSNGVLTSRSTAAGWTTSTWTESSPMAPYLATLVIGHYRVSEGSHNGRPVVTAVDASLPTTIDGYLARTPEVVDYLQTKFGPYPFDAMGGIVIADGRIRFALENQTRPVYSRGFFTDPARAVDVVVHELAHQWFGDSVSVYNWGDIWLNEGFATYAEWLWAEDHGGPTAEQAFAALYQGAPAAMWTTPPGRPPLDDLFAERGGNSVYARGAMTLQALRHTVGDDTFFRILKEWAASRAGTAATTAQFVELADRLSGRSLDQLFAAWLYGSGRPDLPGR